MIGLQSTMWSLQSAPIFFNRQMQKVYNWQKMHKWDTSGQT